MQLGVSLVDRRPVSGVELGGGNLASLEQSGGLLGGQAKRVDQACPLPNPLGGCKGAPTGTLTSAGARVVNAFAPKP